MKLRYCILGVNIHVHCTAPDLRLLIDQHWGHMASLEPCADLSYSISRDGREESISIARDDHASIFVSDDGQCLYELEGDACIALQTLRQELYFVHAAVAEFERRAFLFVAESGGGKSTTVWGLLHHGWSYLSDELAPIEISSLQVHAYPRALCLKRRPPPNYPLPKESIETSRTLHIPVQHLPRVSPHSSCPLSGMYFVNYCPHAAAPQIREITAAEASARLYACTLNQLAHANAGLDPAIQIAKRIPAFTLDSADLAATCDVVCSHSRQRSRTPNLPG